MNSYGLYLFFAIVIVVGAITNQIAGGYTGGENPEVAAINELYNSKMLQMSDVELGIENPLGMEFGGNILAAPAVAIAFWNAITLDYEWLRQSQFAFIRWIYMAYVLAAVIVEGQKAMGGILNALTGRFRMQ